MLASSVVICISCISYSKEHPITCTIGYIGEPLITDGPVDLFIITNGSSAVFSCGALAFPEHNIFWTFTSFNGTEEAIISTVMTGSSSKYLIVVEKNNSRFGELTVMNVEFGDRGVYTCSAANDVGIAMASTNLTVHGMVNVITSPKTDVLYT